MLVVGYQTITKKSGSLISANEELITNACEFVEIVPILGTIHGVSTNQNRT